MSVYELLKVARQDWQDDKRAEREAGNPGRDAIDR